MLQYCIKQIQTNINMYILHVLSIKLRGKLYFSFSIPTPGFPHFYYMLGANLWLLLYGEVSVMPCFLTVYQRTPDIAISEAWCFLHRSHSLSVVSLFILAF